MINNHQRYKAYHLVLQTSVSSTQDSSVAMESKRLESQFRYEIEELIKQGFCLSFTMVCTNSTNQAVKFLFAYEIYEFKCGKMCHQPVPLQVIFFYNPIKLENLQSIKETMQLLIQLSAV